MKTMLMAVLAVAVAVTFSVPSFAGEGKKKKEGGDHVVVYGEKKKKDEGKADEIFAEKKKKDGGEADDTFGDKKEKPGK